MSRHKLLLLKYSKFKLNMKILLIIAINFMLIYQSYAQCGCSGAPIAGATPYGGAVNLRNQRPGSIFASAFYRYTYGDSYQTGSKNIGKGYIQFMKSSYMGVFLSYGLMSDLSLDGDFGYYFDKTQDFSLYQLNASGPSHFSLSAKYNVYSHLSQKFDFSISAGGRLPLNNFSESTDNTLPQHLKTSTGAFGGFITSNLRKGFSGTDFFLYLINRFDFNGRNRLEYQYGKSLYSSLLASKQIIGGLSGSLEIRNELRGRDFLQGSSLDSTGSNVFTFSPALSYSLGKWNITGMYDIPFYKNFNGSQLATAYSLSVFLSIGL